MVQRRRGSRAILLLVLTLAATLAPLAAGQGSSQAGSGTSSSTGLAPAYHGYASYRGILVWGNVEPLPTDGRIVQDLAVGHKLLAWVGAQNYSHDVYVYDLTGRVLHRVTNDSASEARPAVQGNYVVWEKRTNSGGAIQAYDVANDTVWTVARHLYQMDRPAISYPYVAWTDRRNGTWNVHVADLRSGHDVQVSHSTYVATDPVFAGHFLAWREEDYGEWDVFVHNMVTGATRAVTRDSARETNLATDGTTFSFVRPTGPNGFTSLMRYDPRTRALTNTGLQVGGGSILTLDGTSYATLVRYVQGFKILVGNLTTGLVSDLTLTPGNFTSTLGYDHGTIYTSYIVGDSTDLLAIHVNPLALTPPPHVVIRTPSPSAILVNRTTVSGRIAGVGLWGSPTSVLVRIDSGPWLPVRGADNWTVDLSLAGLVPGSHTIQVAASFDAGPPRASRVNVVVLSNGNYAQDLRPYLSAQRVGLLQAIGDDGLLLLLTLLIVAAVVLGVTRAYLRWLVDRPGQVLYVPPEEPAAPLADRWVPPAPSDD